MDAVLALQISVGILPGHHDSGAFDARHGIVLKVHHFRLEALLFAIPKVHPLQHFRPVHGIHAAGARIDGKDGVIGIVAAAQQHAELQLFHVFLQRTEIPANLLGFLLVVQFFRQVNQIRRII